MAATVSSGGNGGNAVGGNGGNGGEGAIGEGGGIFDASTGTLTINPRTGRQEGFSPGQGHQRDHGQPGLRSGSAGTPGSAGTATVGFGGTPRGASGHLTGGTSGTVDPLSVGVGGGIAIIGAATIDNTTITGNHASTNDNDVLGAFSS